MAGWENILSICWWRSPALSVSSLFQNYDERIVAKTFECSLPGCNRETLYLKYEVSHLCKTVTEMRCLLGLSEVISLLFTKYQATEQTKQVNG